MVSEEVVPGLPHQVRAVGQEQNAMEFAVLQAPVAERAGGEGLAGAGS
jgi:hypothetical protein